MWTERLGFAGTSAPTARQLGSLATVASAVYSSGGYYAPGTPAPLQPVTPTYLEVYYGPAVAATASPTPAPTLSPTRSPTVMAEGWTSKRNVPLGVTNTDQSCAAVDQLGLFYQYLATGSWLKYSAATDAWVTGARFAARIVSRAVPAHRAQDVPGVQLRARPTLQDRT